MMMMCMISDMMRLIVRNIPPNFLFVNNKKKKMKESVKIERLYYNTKIYLVFNTVTI